MFAKASPSLFTSLSLHKRVQFLELDSDLMIKNAHAREVRNLIFYLVIFEMLMQGFQLFVLFVDCEFKMRVKWILGLVSLVCSNELNSIAVLTTGNGFID